MSHDNDSRDSMRFHCRSPIYMCAACSHAQSCNDLLNILRIFRFEEIEPEFDYMKHFPFLEERTGEVDPRNKLNDLSSPEWMNSVRTVLSEEYPKMIGHEFRRSHPEYKSPHLMGKLIAFFSAPGDMVLDPFAGTGTSLVAAALLDRKALGFEIEKKWIDAYLKLCKKEQIPMLQLVHGDCAEHTPHLPKESIDFVIIDPPDPLSPETWAREPLEEPPEEAFFRFLFEIIRNCERGLKDKKYLAVFTRNCYRDGRYHFLTPYFAACGEDAGLTLKGEKIWDNPLEKNRPYGYPHTYVPNIVHHHILIFQKS